MTTVATPARIVPSPPKPANPANRDQWAAAIMISPNLLLFTIFVGIPIIGAILLSFCHWNLTGFPAWAGLANYSELVRDPTAKTALVNTILFALFGVAPTVVLGLLIAVLINVPGRVVNVFRTLYYVPAVVSFAASAVLWQWIYHPSTGILDFFLSKVGISGPQWLSDSSVALPALDVIGIWMSLPVSVLLYMAALQRIPESTLEAATLDGCGPVRRMVYIIWPGVRPMSILVAIVAFLAFTNGSFDLVNIMTQGGPVNATTTLIYYTYYQSIDNLNLGYGAALTVLQLLLIIVVIAGARGLQVLGARR
jgi:multiple sugar transport system permease protein